MADDDLTITEAARYLALSPVTVRRIIARGELPSRHDGGTLIRRADLDAWVERQRLEPCYRSGKETKPI